SLRLSTTEELPLIAANRNVEPRKLADLVRGELDWIVMKCLEKDRSRRYEAANSLASDIERYLRQEPVKAGPPSATYRLRKFARRNWKALAAGLLAVAALVAAVVGLAVSNRLIRREQVQTKAALDVAVKARRRAREALDRLSSRIVGDWLGRQ